LDFWAANFYAVVDPNTCEACGACERRCQVGAVRVFDKKKAARVNSDRCLGCGVCVPGCPTGSITLVKKTREAIPPRTREDLLQSIMAAKKGRLGKLKLSAKLIVDIVRTGNLNLLKP
jgi:MinD superfamily P-loop ATPase